MNKLLVLPVVLVLCQSCSRENEKDFLGAANVEMKVYQVSPAVQGTLLEVKCEEGSSIKQGALLAILDTLPFSLQIREINANLSQISHQLSAKEAESAIARNDASSAKRERDRMKGLADKGAAPLQQADNLESQALSAELRAKAAALNLPAFQAQVEMLLARKAQLELNLSRCYVKSPCNGIVLVRYRHHGEMALPSAPIYEIGEYDTAQIDFFMPEPLLAGLSVGGKVRLRLDTPDGKGDFLPAQVTWISNTAEFSPKNIQTRESRNGLYFKVRVKCANPSGRLKRGLPVEVWR
ncbi:MAG: hypothetical protein A2293_10705 [Elusimicrobia bacterium RIFOXYB2_FULL_49_7]|nr:MAG: hypothetical protein A2293_10705 [Elusimicrobia bacterium RIFOXYB2_FULL_49_7]